MNKVTLPSNLGNPLLLHAIAHSNISDIITLIEDKEADINARNINGSTTLIYATIMNSEKTVEILLNYKCNPDLQEFHDVGLKTALHYAVEN